MNLRKRSPATQNDKVVNLCLNKHLKHWPENVRRKRRTAPPQLRLNNIPGWCIKKSAMGWVESAKPLDDNDRKMLVSLAAKDSDSTSEVQGFLISSGARCKALTEGSCKTKRVRCPNVSTLSNDSDVNPASVKKYPKQLQMGGASCLNEDLIKFVNCPESISKKRSSSGLSQVVGSVRPAKRQKGTRQKIQTFSTHSLPEEVVEEILSRLPVKSIARFRCVCKSWEHLRYSKRFISLHLNNYTTTQFLVRTCRMMSECSISFLPPPPPSGVYCKKDRDSQETFELEFPNLFGGSCNGIVCLYGQYAVDDIVLWNPGTNESKRIQGLGEFSYSSKCTVGLGYDPLTDDYKILKMVYGKLDPPVAHLELYSLRKGSWKIVDCHEFSVVHCHAPYDIACSLPFKNNRIVCAVVSPVNGASKWEVIKFDMSSETYEVIPMPPKLDAELGDPSPDMYQNRYFKLLPFKESIALGIVHDVGTGSYCDVWVLNDFRCWSKLLSTNMNEEGGMVPVGSWGSSQIIFQETMSDRLYMHLELDHHNKSRMMELQGVVPGVWIFTAPYKASLVRITDTEEA